MDTIKAPQTGRQLDSDLKAILGVLDVAGDNNGQVLYISRGQIAFADGSDLFDIIQLTEET